MIRPVLRTSVIAQLGLSVFRPVLRTSDVVQLGLSMIRPVLLGGAYGVDAQ